MKMYLFFILLNLPFAFFRQPQQQPAAADFNKLNWLAGTWNRANTKPGRTGHERWVKTADNELKGWGITMKGTDTLYVEKLQLLVKDNHIFYVGDVPENKEPVYFMLTRLTQDGFECENPAHDFPKKIAYYHEGNNIKATISGDGRSIDYIFIRSEH